MVKKLSKVLSVLLILAVFVSNIAVVSYAKEDKRGYITNANLIIEDLRDAMTDREIEYTFEYKRKNVFDQESADIFINDIMEKVYAETDDSDEGDYLRLAVSKSGYNMSGYTDGKDCYYTISLAFDYYTTERQEEIVEEKIEDVIDSFDFDRRTTDKDKCDKIYHYITENVRYDNENLDNDEYTLKYTAYAALIDKTAVCQGYATLFYRMAKECGLDVRVISGTSRGVGHAWNIIKFGGMYYYLDSTWDEGEETYKYYLKGTENFSEHTSDEIFLTNEFKANYPIDEFDYGVHTYYKKYEDKFRVEYKCTGCGYVRTDLFVPSGEALVLDDDGEWYYLVDGVKTMASTLLYHDNKLCYVNNGVWDRKANVLVFDGKKYYYIKNGVWDEDCTSIVSSGGKNIYIENGVKSNYTGFVKYEGKYRYIVNGEWTKSTTFVKSGGKYYYVKDGIKNTTTGFVKYGKEYRYVVDGVWTKVTDFIKYNKKEYYVKNGVRSDDTGFVKFSGKYYMIKKGVRSSATVFEKSGNAYLRLSANEYTYDGKKKKPSVVAYDGNGKTISSKNYTVTYAKDTKNVGKYKVTVKFKGKYSGTKNFYFTIKPANTSISKVTALNKSLKVTLKKKSKQVTGYEIQYSTAKDFKSAKIKKVSSYKTTSVTLNGLKAKKNYYVRVRTYKKVGSTVYYSQWSNYKTKNTK